MPTYAASFARKYSPIAHQLARASELRGELPSWAAILYAEISRTTCMPPVTFVLVPQPATDLRCGYCARSSGPHKELGWLML
jgi:hypothetical protein